MPIGNRLALAALLAGLAAGAAAGGTITPQLGGGISQFDGGISTPVGSVGTPSTPCGNAALDWSDATGCNLTLYMIGLR